MEDLADVDHLAGARGQRRAPGEDLELVRGIEPCADNRPVVDAVGSGDHHRRRDQRPAAGEPLRLCAGPVSVIEGDPHLPRKRVDAHRGAADDPRGRRLARVGGRGGGADRERRNRERRKAPLQPPREGPSRRHQRRMMHAPWATGQATGRVVRR